MPGVRARRADERLLRKLLAASMLETDEPVDLGRNPGSRNVYVHTGDSGQGITNGVAGSLTITPLILGEDSRYAPVLDPGRKSSAVEAVSEFIRGQAGVVRNLAEHLGPGELSSVEELKCGEGGIIRR